MIYTVKNIAIVLVTFVVGSTYASEANYKNKLDLVLFDFELSSKEKTETIKRLVESGTPIDTLYNVSTIGWWDVHAMPFQENKATALGIVTCGNKYSCDSIIADSLVEQGAALSSAYCGKFGFYFIKRLLDMEMIFGGSAKNLSRFLETLLYRRVQYCYKYYCEKQMMILHCIAQRIKKRELYPSMTFKVVPKPILALIERYIIVDGIQDVMHVLHETAVDGNRPNEYTLHQALQLYNNISHEKLEFRDDRQPFSSEAWIKDVDEFVLKKRNNEWLKTSKNLIATSIRYTKNSLYSDKDFWC